MFEVTPLVRACARICTWLVCKNPVSFLPYSSSHSCLKAQTSQWMNVGGMVWECMMQVSL